MNARELKAERIRKGKSVQDMADALGLTYYGYLAKEHDGSRFNQDQILTVALELNLTAELINRIFFDCRLPLGDKAC